MNKTDLQQLAENRIQDAKVLLDNQRWSAAYYLAGYAVECGLKACIAKLTKPHDFPDKDLANKCWTHDIEKLVVVANLKENRDADVADADADAKTNTNLTGNWGLVKDWKESSRYESKTQSTAEALFEAITDPTDGVLPWIKLHW